MENRKKGKVWLVGAGPSDAGLFTLKGRALLESADVVVYDKLVGHGVMSMIPAGVRKISVGKVSGHHPIPQHEINRILLDEALAGNRVVRLKGGDPFVFGRGGEELELLCEHEIPFEIVPGITSAVSVPAYNGIPVTHRDCCSSLHIITGHTKKSEEAEIDYEALVKVGGTMIFLMGVTAMPKICKGLIEAGMNPDMPAAVLERGTTAHQRRVVSTVAQLADDSERAEIKTPAIIIVGEVCRLERNFHWAEERPFGKIKIAVTRPKKRSSSLAAKLSELGAEVVLMPTIETEAISDNHKLKEALGNIGIYSWIMFTSAEGVDVFCDTLKAMRMDIRSLAGIRFAVIGAGTERALSDRGIFADLVPEIYSGDRLGRLMAQTARAEERILIPRAAKGTEEVVRPLMEAGLEFDDIPVYDTKEGGGEAVSYYDETVDWVAFTSASTVRGFVKLNPEEDFTCVKALCIGEQTAAAAKEFGMQVTISEKATIDSMIGKLLEIVK